MITNTEFILLALISEQPRHGYNIEAELENRGMREWTEIGFSSIYYSLTRLERSGYLSSRIDISGDKPARKIYTITIPGMNVLRDAVAQRLSSPRPRSGDFDLGLSYLPILPVDEVIRCLDNYVAILSDQQKHVMSKKVQESRNPSAPGHIETLFDHSLTLMQSELDWVTKLIKSLRG